MEYDRKKENVKDIKQEVIKKVTPTEKERRDLLKLFEKIKKIILKKDKEKLIKKVELVGSVAKNTFLKGEGDLDIFIFFDESISRDKLEEYGLMIGKEVFNELKIKHVIKYAEHPYVKGSYKGIKIEIVPAYYLESINKVVSAVDRTPFHKKYVIEHLKNPEEVLILKKFMKSIGVYGSELAVKGFSGYAAELLIIKYKRFEEVLKAAINWKEKEVICLKSCNKKKIIKKFKDAAFIIVDPVDPNRNVTAAVSKQSFMKFKIFSYLFLSHPSLKFFEHVVPSYREVMQKVKKTKRHYFIAHFKNNEKVIEDIIMPQLEKLRKLAIYFYKLHDFAVVRSFPYYCSKGYGLYFEFHAYAFSTERHVEGPDLKADISRIKNFLKKYKEVWVDENGKINANTPRLYKKPEDFFLNLKDKDFNELRQQGIPKNIAKDYKSLKIKKLERCNEFIKRLKLIETNKYN